MSKKQNSFSSSTYPSTDDDDAMWLDGGEDDELVGGTKPRFTVSKMEEGKGKSKRVCFK
jgi:hypothetical protein